jgi:hypothetical protein
LTLAINDERFEDLIEEEKNNGSAALQVAPGQDSTALIQGDT